MEFKVFCVATEYLNIAIFLKGFIVQLCVFYHFLHSCEELNPKICFTLLLILDQHTDQLGHAVAQLVEALRYKSEGRGFDSRWCHLNFSFT